MNEAQIIEFITKNYEGVYITHNGGDAFFLYDPEGKFPLATLITSDDDYDQSANLNRPGVFRLNVGVSKEKFREMFGTEDRNYDYTALDTIMPHPVYGKMYWVGVLNPSQETFDNRLKPMLDAAYQKDVAKYARKAARKKEN